MVQKSKFVVVLLQSVITGHRAFYLRERAGEKLEKLMFDPQSKYTQLVVWIWKGIMTFGFFLSSYCIPI